MISFPAGFDPEALLPAVKLLRQCRLFSWFVCSVVEFSCRSSCQPLPTDPFLPDSSRGRISLRESFCCSSAGGSPPPGVSVVGSLPFAVTLILQKRLDFGVICCMFLWESLQWEAGKALESPDQKVRWFMVQIVLPRWFSKHAHQVFSEMSVRI
jgi:hypothetical protein